MAKFNEVITSPNQIEIRSAHIDLLGLELKRLDLKDQLAAVENKIKDTKNTLEYLGGKCSTCGEYGVSDFVVIDDSAFCVRCR